MLSLVTLGVSLLVPLGLAVLLGLLVHRRPVLGLVLWLVAVAFVPVWFGVQVMVFVLPTSLAALFVLVSVSPGLPRRWGGADLVALLFFVSCVVPVFIGESNLSTVYGAVAQWMLAFLLGRLLPVRIDLETIGTVITVVFGAVAVLAILEFFVTGNLFVDLGPSNRLHSNWGTIQIRGGIARTEGAFGHSIALGSCLAMAIPFMILSRFRPWIRGVLVLVALLGVVTTFSRISLVGAGVGLVLTLYSCWDRIPRRFAIGLSTAVVAGALAAVPFVGTVFSDAGSEAANSAGYRSDLTQLIPLISPLGISSSASRTSSGELWFGRFQSIDSALIFGGLTYGWFALGLALVLLVAAGLLVLVRRAEPATVAVVAQIPALATVALITQYSMFFWFIAGLAVAAQAAAVQRRSADSVDRPPTGDEQRTQIQVVHSGAADRSPVGLG